MEGKFEESQILVKIFIPDFFLGTKCDVCVLSEETQVFRLVDAILESNLWPLAEEDLEEEEEILEESEKETEIGGQEVCNLTCNSVIQGIMEFLG